MWNHLRFQKLVAPVHSVLCLWPRARWGKQGRHVGDRLAQWVSQTVRDRVALRLGAGKRTDPRHKGPAAELAPQAGLEVCQLVLAGRAHPGTVPFQNVGRQKRSWRFPTGGRQSHNQGPLHQLK